MRKSVNKFLLGVSVIALAGFLNTYRVQAQSPYELGTQTFSAGIGLGWSYSYFSNGTSFPAISLSYDYNIYEIEDVGMLSVGGIFGFKKSTWKDPSSDYKKSVSSIVFGARGALHLDLFDNPNLDTYGGVMLGIRSEQWKNNNPTYFGFNNYTDTRGLYGLFVGTRYFFNPNIAVYGELGYGISILNLGVSFEL